jgi:hypothetical protein
VLAALRLLADRVRTLGEPVRRLVRDRLGRHQEQGQRLVRLRSLKRVHDRLHNLQIMVVRQVEVAARTFPDGTALLLLPAHTDLLGNLIGELEGETRNPRQFPRPVTWLEIDLVTAREALEDAVGLAQDPAAVKDAPRFTVWLATRPDLAVRMAAGTAADVAVVARSRLDLAIGRLRQVITQVPTRINNSLFTLAGEIDLEGLAGTLRDLAGPLREAGVDDEDQLRAASEELTLLGRQQQDLIGRHNHWQEVDDLVRATDSQLSPLTAVTPTSDVQDRNLESLAAAWGRLAGLTAGLFQPPVPTDLKPLHDRQKKLTEALSGRRHFDALQAFLAYAGQVTQIFHKMDERLLALCERLGEFGPPLQAALEA